MIRSFQHKGLRQLFEEGKRQKLPPEAVERIENILLVLNQAERPEDIDLPGFRLHPLKGDMKGFWAVTVRATWRVVFRLEEGDVWDVNLVDYH
jgi:proteic killer suppression protein